jgi:hypothetical protein
MQRSSSPNDCRLCGESTVARLADVKKRLLFWGTGAEHVREIIKSFVKEYSFATDFTFKEPDYRATDYVCSRCIATLISYEKAKKRFEELEALVKKCLQSIVPAATTVPTTTDSSPFVSPLGVRKRSRLGMRTSTPKRLRVEPTELPDLPAQATSTEREYAPVKVRNKS